MGHTHDDTLELKRGNGEVPAVLKYLMVFIDRVGFPIVAFLIMTYLCFVSLRELGKTIEGNTQALTNVAMEIKNLRESRRP